MVKVDAKKTDKDWRAKRRLQDHAPEPCNSVVITMTVVTLSFLRRLLLIVNSAKSSSKLMGLCNCSMLCPIDHYFGTNL